MTDVRLSPDNYLLQKSFPSKSIKRVVDISKVDLSEEAVKKHLIAKSKKDWPIEKYDEEVWAIHELYSYDKVKEGDVIVEYNDLGPLCGSAGFLLIRDGYIHRQYTTRRA